MEPIETSLAEKYQRRRGLGASSGVPAAPGPEAVAALWSEQLCARRLRLADGRSVEVLQPGLPERPGALRFAEAAVRFDGGEPQTGMVAVGAAEGVLLSLFWKGGSGAAAALETQLAVPWEEAAEGIEFALPPPPPRLREEVAPASVPVARRLELARAAGLYRLEQRARRLALREKTAGRLQLLWEEVAGALGYHANQEPFRHLARRLSVAFLRAVEEEEPDSPEALLFGVAGFLPGEKLAGLSAPARALARTLWDRWWKARAALDYAVLPASAWTVARVRPANRPERRLAALVRLLPHLERLDRAVARRDEAAFARVLAEIHDPFWSRHATWKSRSSAKPSRLVGPERVDALAGNLFWPLVALDDPEAARLGMERLGMGGSRAEREGWERLFGSDLPPRSGSALVRQGILQLRRDAPDGEALARLVRSWA